MIYVGQMVVIESKRQIHYDYPNVGSGVALQNFQILLYGSWREFGNRTTSGGFVEEGDRGRSGESSGSKDALSGKGLCGELKCGNEKEKGVGLWGRERPLISRRSMSSL